MRIEDITATPAATAGEPISRSTVGSPDEFLRLFVAQLEHQNPLDPQSSADFVAQLAQFTTVEQGAETNRRLNDILAGQMSSSNAAMAGFVGKTGTVEASRFTVTGHGQGIPGLALELDKATASLEVVIRDAQGGTVRRIQLGPQPAGRVTVPWDGTAENGAPIARGDYQVEVVAQAAGGGVAVASPIMIGLIQALDFIDGAPRLRIGAVSAMPSDILSIQ
jgi:flagellar basal-body rod modification protein FlgD